MESTRKLNIRDIRKKRGMTQNELSKKSGIGIVTICRLETGQQKDLSASNLFKIADALDTTVENIFTE